MGLTTTALVADFGSYYQKGSQGAQNLFQKIYQGGEFDSAFSRIITEDTIHRNVLTTSDEMLQGFQNAFTPKGDAEFIPSVIILDHIKADATLYPDDIEKTYLGFLASNSLDRKEWPIARWFAEMILVAQLFEDIDINAYLGEAVTPTAGVAGPASAALNGFKKFLLDGIGSGSIPSGNVYNMGTPSTDPEDFVDSIEAFVENIPAYLRARLPLTVHMSHEFALRYKKGMRLKYNANYLQEQSLLQLANHPTIKVQGFQAMAGEPSMFIAAKPNLRLVLKRPTEAIYMESDMRQVKVSTDHYRGYGYVDGRYVWVTDNIEPEEGG